MANLAINVLWFLIGLIVLCGVVYLAIWVIESFVTPIPEQIKKGVWVIILLLALIFLITVLVGGGSHPFRWSGVPGGPLATSPFAAARYLPRLLT
jgi:O-antigen ligase